MTWNHRVVRRTQPAAIPGLDREVTFAIHEIYYDNDGSMSCTKEPVVPMGESLADLADNLKHFVAALNKPVLDYDKDFPEPDAAAIEAAFAEIIAGDEPEEW